MKGNFIIQIIEKTTLSVCCLTLFCIAPQKLTAQEKIGQAKIKTIVIDAGHGGKDTGTRGKYTNEKDVTLAVALKLGNYIKTNYPEINVLYTRKSDKTLELRSRGQFANKHNADLFISIHVDGITDHSVRGASTWVMGLHKSNANMAVSQRENSVITLEDDYSSKYEGYDPKSPESFIMFSLLQNTHLDQSIKLADYVQSEMIKNGPVRGNRGVRQAGFLVLWQTAMPSILIELGFLTNPTEESLLTNANNQSKIAKSIFNAFDKYKHQYESGSGGTIEERKKEQEPEFVETKDTQKAEIKTEKVTYSVQIMASPKKINTSPKNFKGCKGVSRKKSGNIYKYTVGNSYSQSEMSDLCKKMRKKFSGAFVIKNENEN